mmetsp:Transcript_4888/g.10070  ORF Transcript_4888/g.10070 Transcript_4888/m.10070 type:complete len:102 (+) Transcript_4888:125-430(+)
MKARLSTKMIMKKLRQELFPQDIHTRDKSRSQIIMIPRIQLCILQNGTRIARFLLGEFTDCHDCIFFIIATLGFSSPMSPNDCDATISFKITDPSQHPLRQ